MSRRIIWTLTIVFGVSGLIVLIWFSIILANNYSLTGKLLPQDTGIVGDFIGGVVGTLWSLTGIFLFYLAISYQRDDLKTQQKALNLQTEELKLQREELKLQREEMTETRKVVKEQSETLKVQKFENTFFNLIDNHVLLVDSLPVSRNRDVIGKNQVLNEMSEFVSGRLESLRTYIGERKVKGYSKRDYSSDFLLSKMKKCEPIFDDLIFIITFILQSSVNEKPLYYRILYNSISPQERILFGFFLEFSPIDFELSQESIEIFQKEFLDRTESLIRKTTIFPPEIIISINKVSPHSPTNISADQFIDKFRSLSVAVRNGNSSKLTLSNFKLISPGHLNRLFLDEKVNDDIPSLKNFILTPFKNISNELITQIQNANRFEFVLEAKFRYHKSEYIYSQLFTIQKHPKTRNNEEYYTIM